MEISTELKKFLQKNKDLLADGKILELYGKIYDCSMTGKFTDLLLDSGVDIWDYFEKEMPDNAFVNSTIENVVVPGSVMNISSSAFYNCNKLTSVTIHDGVTGISYAAFYNCIRLTNVIMGNSVRSIGAFAFYNCGKLTNINISDSVTSIGNWAFGGCYSLMSVAIPNGVTRINAGVFGGCRRLTDINIPDSVKSIGNSAFSNCYSLTSIVYGGTKEQWEKIEKHEKWNTGAKIKSISCIDGEIKL